jgi:hypothetical protein
MGNTYNIDDEKNKNPQSQQNVQQNAQQSGTLYGVDKATQDKMNQGFTASGQQQEAQGNASGALTNLGKLTNKQSIISGNTKNALNAKFKQPAVVTEADNYINNQLKVIQSGKTSYSDQLKDMMSQIMGRDKFAYDVDSDPLFQQALASAMNSGKQAMQDTMGQASALTGGYGSTYATMAGNQAYNSFVQDAYNNLPQYYQMAMEAYQMEGDEMYRQFDMVNSADEKEYGRNVNAYETTFNYRNRMYDEAYQKFRDEKSDAFNMAGLEISEHGQLVSDAYNYYNASSNYANNLYTQDFNKWQSEIDQAYKYASMLNSNYWNKTNFDEGVRQYEQNFAEEQRQFDKSYEQTEKWNQADLDYKNNALAQDQSQFESNQSWQSSENALNREHDKTMQDDAQAWNDANREDNQVFEASENSKYKTKDGGTGKTEDTTETQKMEKSIPSGIKTKVSKFKNNGDIESYLDSQVANGTLTEEQADYLYSTYRIEEQAPLSERDWSLVDNGGTNWFGGIDGNGVVKDQYGTEYKIDDLYDELKKTMSKDDAKKYVKDLQKTLGITK